MSKNCINNLEYCLRSPCICPLANEEWYYNSHCKLYSYCPLFLLPLHMVVRNMFSAARLYAKLVRKNTRELLQKLTRDSIARRASVVFDNAKNPVFMTDARRRTAESHATQFTMLMSKMVLTPFNSILRIPTPWPTIPCRTAKAAIARACRVAIYMVTIFTTKPI